MTKRIFRAICLVVLSVFAASVLLFSIALYNYFSDVRLEQLRVQTELAATAVSNEGISYFDGFYAPDYRITWIAADGEVLFDSRTDSDGMENHLEREEIKEALATGSGESSRYSVTLMERAIYSAKRLPDGSVLRMSVRQNTLLTLLLGMSQPLAAIILIAIVLSMILAASLSKSIVKPLNGLNLDDPLSNKEYDELSPLLHRLDSQQEQIKAQKAELLRKRREFETLTENMTEGIILLNSEGDILDINPAAKRLFGSDNPVGQPLISLNRSTEISELLDDISCRSEKMLDVAGRRYQLILSPVISENSPSGAVLLMIDVTEKERSEQLRRDFTANVSHELKTPLHTIAGSAELLLNGMVRHEDMPDFYQRIYKESRRMTRLVEDIIHLSHLDEGAEDLKRERVDLFAIAQETVKSLLPEAESAGVAMNITGEPAEIYGVPQLLGSIVYNLCDNAIKYNRDGGRVDVTVRRQGVVVLTVEDNGIGIPPEHQKRIFERFYRVDKSRSKELGGTGLGLSIVKHAARLHGAKIELKSEVGKGTTVTVAFC